MGVSKIYPSLSPNIWLREISSSTSNDHDIDDAYVAIDQWPEFFVGGNCATQNNGDDGNHMACTCASLQVSSFVVPPLPPPLDATFVVDSLIQEEDIW